MGEVENKNGCGARVMMWKIFLCKLIAFISTRFFHVRVPYLIDDTHLTRQLKKLIMLFIKLIVVISSLAFDITIAI